MLILAWLVAVSTEAGGAAAVYRIDHVVDGDTVALRNGQRVRLVQIDTPEVFFGAECYGRDFVCRRPGGIARVFAAPELASRSRFGIDHAPM